MNALRILRLAAVAALALVATGADCFGPRTTVSLANRGLDPVKAGRKLIAVNESATICAVRHSADEYVTFSREGVDLGVLKVTSLVETDDVADHTATITLTESHYDHLQFREESHCIRISYDRP